MQKINLSNRIEFLKKKFNVFENESNFINHFQNVIRNPQDNQVLASISEKNEISINSVAFNSIVEADPTKNKIYIQWLLNIFSSFLKSDFNEATRFIIEDLPKASLYIKLFDKNKRKKIFLNLNKNNKVLENINDLTNINQYKSLSELFNAIDPFIEKKPNNIKNQLLRFVEANEATIPVENKDYILYIPKTTEASVVFDNFTNWCTAKAGNGSFKNYITQNKKPNGENSDIYIIIDKKFFTGKNNEIFQIHFETNQLKNRENKQELNSIVKILNKNKELSNFFGQELKKMNKESIDINKGIENNSYIDYLIKFGFNESIFEFLPKTIQTVKFSNREIKKLTDLTKFTQLHTLIIRNSELSELHPSIKSLSNLEILVLNENKITILPKEIGKLNKLIFLNLNGNKIKEIPDEISLLDKSNGGSLLRIFVQSEDVGTDNFLKLKKLLPTTEFY